MIFRDIELSDRDWLDKKFREDNKKACEFCFANNYLWRKYFPTQIATEGDCVILRYYAENDAMYVFPIGNGDKKKALEQLFLYGQAKGEQIHLYGLLDYEVEQLKEWYPKHFRYEADRDMFDYIYETEHLANLSGKKFHGKRNHIARFMDDDDWEYEKLNSENLHDCIDMNNNWIQKKYDDDAWSQEVQDEYDVVKCALIDYKRLGLVGGVLKKYGEVVAFEIGEPLNDDTFVVHFEKAYADVQGAYPMINKQFVLHECQGYKYVNREEDDGEEGLRKAKLSYHPDILLEKYNAYKIG